MSEKVDFISCPLCGRNRPIETHLKGQVKFKYWTKEDPIIQIRDCLGGRKGFPIVDGISFQDAIADPNYRNILLEMKEQINYLEEIFNQMK